MQRALEQLASDRAVPMLRERTGLMAQLGSESGTPRLDWVDGVPRLLHNENWLEEVEDEAAQIVESRMRHIIWSGMGGSVMTVRVMEEMGLCRGGHRGVTIHPLDSTDPAALNRLVRRLAEEKALPLHGNLSGRPLEELLHDVMMIGVSMGMTSEEPITHLAWFLDLLTRAHLPLSRHCLVMTLPGSYLARFAAEHGLPSRPLQLDEGTGTGGRMSAPTTRVFLLPAALALSGAGVTRGGLRAVLQRAWREYDLDLAESYPREHPFVRLAAAMDGAAEDGTCRVLLTLPARWSALFQWIEQLMEESLGKDGKGVVMFHDQHPVPSAPCFRPEGSLHVLVATEAERPGGGAFVLRQPYLRGGGPEDLLAGLAATFLGWQLAMALYGYLQNIHFAGQPAVEEYKARARELRTGDPLGATESWEHRAIQGPITLLLPPGLSGETTSPTDALAAALRRSCPTYLDLTINGELSAEARRPLQATLRALGNHVLGVPVKLRVAPAAYHSTEQSEMDGPAGLVSMRVVALAHESSFLGQYTATFLLAQAVGTWQAMVEYGRPCFLLLLDGSLEERIGTLAQLLDAVGRRLR